MPKRYSSAQIERVLKSKGFIFVGQKGLHGKFKHINSRIVILPMNKKEIPIGTFYSILKQMEISASEFEKILS